MKEIIERLYIGSINDACKPDQLAEKGIKSIVCVTEKGQEICPKLFQDSRFCSIYLPVPDTVEASEKIRKALPRLTDFIHSERDAGNSVFVFCQYGQSRSGTVILAYLMQKQHYSLRSAFWHSRQQHDELFPNVGFFVVLQELDIELNGSLSMPMNTHQYLNIKKGRQTSPSRSVQVVDAKNSCCGKQNYGTKMSRVVDNIYIGNMSDARNVEKLRSNRIRCMLNLVPDYVAATEDETITYCELQLPHEDSRAGRKIRSLWKHCHKFLQRCGNRRVLVHCRTGRGQSSAVVISWLMVSQKYTLHHAFWSVLIQRPGCFPNYGVFRALEELEIELHGNTSFHLSEKEYSKVISGSKNPLYKRAWYKCYRNANQLRRMASKKATVNIGFGPMRRLYGALRIQLQGRLCAGDLLFIESFKEEPHSRCFLVVGDPNYYQDQSDLLGVDVFSIEVLAPVPASGNKPITMELTNCTFVIEPETYQIRLVSGTPTKETISELSKSWQYVEAYVSPLPMRAVHPAKIREMCLELVSGVSVRHPNASSGADRFMKRKRGPLFMPNSAGIIRKYSVPNLNTSSRRSSGLSSRGLRSSTKSIRSSIKKRASSFIGLPMTTAPVKESTSGVALGSMPTAACAVVRIWVAYLTWLTDNAAQFFDENEKEPKRIVDQEFKAKDGHRSRVSVNVTAELIKAAEEHRRVSAREFGLQSQDGPASSRHDNSSENPCTILWSFKAIQNLS